MKTFTLVAFSAERRIAAIGVFSGTHLQDIRLRHLSNRPTQATGSVRELVTRAIDHHRPGFIAIHHPVAKTGVRIRQFAEAVKEIADEFGIPSTLVDDKAMMSAYGHPVLTRTEHVRKIGRVIWPSLESSLSKRAAVDAATAGLYVQVQRLFSLNEVQA
jgi:hypothetical protein